MSVNRCVCHDVKFSEILRLAREQGLSLEQIEFETGAGQGCGACRPYLPVVLASGRTQLPPLSKEELASVLKQLRAPQPAAQAPRSEPPAPRSL